MMGPIRFALVLCLVCLTYTPAALGDVDTPRAFIFDEKYLSVTALALENGEVLGTVDLQGKPERIEVSPDGRRLVAIDKGKGKQTMRFGYHPKEKSWVTVIDAETMEVLNRLEVGWTASTGLVLDGVGVGGQWSFSPDGRYLTLACLGYRSQKPHETLPAELVTIDLELGKIAHRLELDRRINGFLEAADKRMAILFSGYLKGKKKQPSLPAQLTFVDLEKLQVLNKVTLEGETGVPILSPDGGYLYLLEYGKPDKKPEKHINGRVHVVSLADREYEVSLDVGSGPDGLIVDEEGLQVFVLSDDEPTREKKKEDRRGLLHVIRSATAAATLEVGEKPLFIRITPDREWLYVVSEKSLTAVDLFALRETVPSELRPAGMTLWTRSSKEKTASEIAFTSDSKTAYVLYAESSKLGVYDLTEKIMLAELSTGRGGIKFAKFMGAVAASYMSYSAGYSAAVESGSCSFTYYVYTIAPASTAIVFGPEEKFVYVLNTNSNDVTIVDTQTHEEVNKIGVGGDSSRLKLLPGGDFVAVTTGKQTLHLIDTTTHQKTSEVQVGGNFVLSPDEAYAVALGNKEVYCLKGSTLETLGTAGNFEKPIQLLFSPYSKTNFKPVTENE